MKKYKPETKNVKNSKILGVYLKYGGFEWFKSFI